MDYHANCSALYLQHQMGVDEALGDTSTNWFLWQEKLAFGGYPQTENLPITPSRGTKAGITYPTSLVPPPPKAEKIRDGMDVLHTAFSAQSIAELEKLLMSYDGCSLKTTATKTVFADGNPESRVMLIGEAPGAEEDRIGKPFVGPAGQLLDRMLGAIGLTRGDVYITNVCYWRPPGNRKPSETEWSACRPFTIKHIELADPKAILLLGGSAVQQVLNITDGITRIRGRWQELKLNEGKTVPILATFHPAYLLRQPAAKKESWHDLLSFHKKII